MIKIRKFRIGVRSKYHPLEGVRFFNVLANSKKDAWDILQFEILCTDEYRKVSCKEVK